LSNAYIYFVLTVTANTELIYLYCKYFGVLVYKFGGASVKDADAIRHVASIIKQASKTNLLVVVSAMGKTTNALEKVVDAYFEDYTQSFDVFKQIIEAHLQVAHELGISNEDFLNEINELVVSIEWLLESEPEDPYNYVYDQVVSVGELFSSKLLSLYLNDAGINANWLDVRDVIITSDTYREAKVDWQMTQKNIDQKIKPGLSDNQIYVGQGFIGSTTDNNTTTLGREGSDFTGAIFAYCLDAEGLHIWKNVEGVLTGDPRIFDHVTKIERMSYMEAIEMTYYGAKVIHPKTIKPLQNKSIPLFVRSFIKPEISGTKVSEGVIEKYPPVVVIEPDQALIHISTKDFSFVAEEHLKDIFEYIAGHRIKVNLMRNTAISFTICVKQEQDKIEKLVDNLKLNYNVEIDEQLSLITVRHYTKEVIESLKSGKMILFEERLEKMIQMVVKEVPVMRIKSE